LSLGFLPQGGGLPGCLCRTLKEEGFLVDLGILPQGGGLPGGSCRTLEEEGFLVDLGILASVVAL